LSVFGDLHVTRRPSWWEDGNDISLDEWLVYVEGDPELTLTGFVVAQMPDGKALRIESPGMTRWDAERGCCGWFDHNDGSITVASPEPDQVAKALSIAEYFGARVQGENGEPLP
jgi:hypothetical protein